jgi:hypothetical protein
VKTFNCGVIHHTPQGRTPRQPARTLAIRSLGEFSNSFSPKSHQNLTKFLRLPNGINDKFFRHGLV